MKSDHRTTSPNVMPSMEEPIEGIESEVVVRPVKNELEAQEAVRLLADQIPVGFSEKIPSMPVKDDGTLRPTLVGAFRDETLVGAAFFGPAEHIAAEAGALLSGREPAMVVYETTQSLIRNVAYMAGIAVLPGHRRQGIGRKIKLFCERWAANHHADVIIGGSTTNEAVALNKSMGYTILPQKVALMLQCVDTKTWEFINQTPVALTRTSAKGMSRWVFKQLTETRWSSICVGQLFQESKIGKSRAKRRAKTNNGTGYHIEWSILNADGTVSIRFHKLN